MNYFADKHEGTRDGDILDSSLSSHMDAQETVNSHVEASEVVKEKEPKALNKFNLLKKFKSKSFLVKKSSQDLVNTNLNSKLNSNLTQQEATLEKKYFTFLIVLYVFRKITE